MRRLKAPRLGFLKVHYVKKQFKMAIENAGFEPGMVGASKPTPGLLPRCGTFSITAARMQLGKFKCAHWSLTMEDGGRVHLKARPGVERSDWRLEFK